MKKYEIELIQRNGQLGVILFRDEQDKKPIVISSSVAPSQWELGRKELLLSALTKIITQLKGEK